MGKHETRCEAVLKKALAKGKTIRHKIEGTSMLPLLKPGQNIWVCRPEKPMKFGDIIVFQSKNKKNVVVHRVVGSKKIKGKMFYLTKGDNCLFLDTGSVAEEKVIGTVVDDAGKNCSGKFTAVYSLATGEAAELFKQIAPKSMRKLLKKLAAKINCFLMRFLAS